MELSMGYELLHTQKVISVSHRFAENAGKMGSKEYALLMHLRKDYPDYAVRPRKNKEAKSHQTYGRLSYEKMANWIAEWDGAQSPKLAELTQVISKAKTCPGAYGIVKKWFLDNYKDRYNKHLIPENLTQAASEPETADATSEDE